MGSTPQPQQKGPHPSKDEDKRSKQPIYQNPGRCNSTHFKEEQRGEPRITKQFTYVTNDSDKFYFSKGAYIDLGMISDGFPSIGETAALDNEPSANQGSTTTSSKEPSSECSCPKRALPRPIPTKMPFAATEENREKLQY